MQLKPALVLPLAAVGVVAVVSWAARSPVETRGNVTLPAATADVSDVVKQVDALFETRWQNEGLKSAETADELQTLRRLSLALHGTIPSLEEIRQFEADDEPDRLGRWTVKMLQDNRYADYLAERLARSYVGTDGGPFILFRRDRFVDWLGKQLKNDRPYDEIVRDLMTGTGLWTGSPATNFMTAAANEGEFDENKLAGRSVKMFLGQRMDCAQCHDHPFADWKQEQFEGLAAHFGQARLSLIGIEDKTKQDKKPVEYEVEDRDDPEQTRVVAPSVPFNPEWLPEKGTRRERLAAWITHPKNRRFERAIANRMWGLMFGLPYITPVDDIPDPGDPNEPDLLDILGADFREHGYDLKRLIRVITASAAFRVDSAHPTTDDGEYELLKTEWAVFPLVRLRPEQVIGSMLQAGSVKTIDQNSHLIQRTMRYFQEQDFVNEYGDLGEDELEERGGTIPQALLRMNGKFARDAGAATPMTAAGRIAAVAGSDEKCLETCYLICLTRRPTEAERAELLPQLQGTQGDNRKRTIEDIYWALLNGPELSWNH